MLQLQNDNRITVQAGNLIVSLSHDSATLEEIQRLRYKVFAEEMGANIQSEVGLDIDEYDAFCHHLVVRDCKSGKVVGTYRLMTYEGAQAHGSWYSESEFDLSRLAHLLPNTVELGRACVHRDFRSGSTITMLWLGLMQFMKYLNLEYMIGCASVSMADGGTYAASLFQQLKRKHYAPADYRVFPKIPIALSDLHTDGEVEPPALLKGYLRAGAWVCGEPHWDADFNTADMLVMMPVSRMSSRYIKHFSRLDNEGK